MKHLFLLAMLAAPTAVIAQNIAPGTVALGGSISYYGGSGSRMSANTSAAMTSSYTVTSTQRQLGLSPALSYFVAENLALGISANYSTGYSRSSITNSTFPYGNNTSTRNPQRTYGAEVFGQHYKMLGGQFGLTGRLGAGYSHSYEHSHTTDDVSGGSSTSKSTGNGYYANLMPGLIFFPSSRIGISLTAGALSYNHQWYESTDNSYGTNGEVSFGSAKGSNSGFSARFGFDQLYLGGAYYFGR